MSIRLMSAAWDLDIPSTEKMVLLALCDFADDTGRNCWPSIDTIAKRCSTSDRTVQRAIRALEQRKILVTDQRSGKSSQYRVDPRQIVRGDKSSGVTKTTQTPDTVSPKPPRTTNNTQKKRAIPFDWMPAEFGERSESRKIVDGWPPGEFEAQLEQFKANHKAKGNKFDDPQAAWSTWVLNSRKFGIARNDRPQRQPNSNSNTLQLAREKLGGSW